jgi:transcriptional repressor NF-X1
MEKIQITCACGGLKQDVKCGATKVKPVGNKRELPCSDACRSRRLAMALDLDPEREGMPTYSDETVAAYNRDPKWSSSIEQKLRTFAENSEQKRLQFTPMRAPLRELIHFLSADYGFDSESQDPEPYRSVVVRKPATVNPVPRKTLAEYVTSKGSTTTAAVAVQQLRKVPRGQAVNAFVLRAVRVGLLSSELEKELSPTLKESQLRFDITWYGDEDVLLKPRASSLAIDQIEAELRNLSTKLKRVVAATGLASSTALSWVGQDGRIANSEGAAGLGWSLANPKKSLPAVSRSTSAILTNKNGFEVFGSAGGSSAAAIVGMQTSKKEKEREREKEKGAEKVEVVDDWEMEAEEV